MKRLFVMMVVVLVGVGLLAQTETGQRPVPQEPETGQRPVPHKQSSEFTTVDVYIDSGAKPLAAWQVEVTPRIGGGAWGKATLVGIEGGGPAGGVYAKPAHYDPAALAPDGGGRVILAAFSTGAAQTLPSGRVRVARLHMFVERDARGSAAEGRGTFDVRLMVAADAEGRAIESATAGAETGPAAGDQP